MGERKGTKGLELWCRRMTEGYPGVNVVNMTTSWRDGLAFCAIIHHFRPDLIEFSKLNKDDIYYNNDLAFRTAERHLGIPALLEPEDMVEFPVPDRLSILTYLSQFYQTFVVAQGKSSARIAAKRPATSPERPPASSSPPTKVAFPSAGKVRREPCAKCNLPVFIAERLNVGKLLYHRTCFRCARCDSQLTLANYYETENNDFCCETCPDEEKNVLTRSLSDEEKSASLKKNEDSDEFSAKFETALEYPEDESLKKNETLTRDYTQARSFLFRSQVDTDSGNDEPPDLPKTKPPESVSVESFSDSGFPKDKKTVNIESRSSLSPASSQLESHDIVTKDTISAEGNTISLVKARMRLFESKSDKTNETQSVNNKVPSNSTNIETLEIQQEKHIESIPRNEEPEAKIEDSVVEKTKEMTSPVNEIPNDIIPKNEESAITISDEESVAVIEISDDVSLKLEESPEDRTEPDPDPEDRTQPDPDPADRTQPDPEDRKQPDPPDPDPDPEKIPSPQKSEEYPDDLNPFGDEDEEPVPQTSVSLNPFDDEEDVPQPTARKKIQPSAGDNELSRIYIERVSLNPFEDEEDIIPQPSRRKIIAPKISLNPFWTDDEENEDSKPVPKPRLSKAPPEAKPREPSSLNSNYGSLTSLTSSQSGVTLRKKKPAPRPPLLGTESGPSSLTSSPSHSVTHSPRSTPKFRKTKKAPLPPTSTPLTGSEAPFDMEDEFEMEKIAKDEQNRNRQSQNLSLQSPSSSENSSSLGAPNKSTHGKWKRKKGLAPSRPIPQRRVIKSLPMAEVKRELELIEVQQQGLEKQGVRLEQIIREKCEAPEINPDESLSPEVEEMVLQLFELVNEKNELFRRQAELMYLRRQQKLEEEHADIEYQIRCLMLQPEANKTDSDKAKEEELINRLVEIVERRNEIIECLEMDRVREAEEDNSINNQLNLYTLKKEEDKSQENKIKKEKKKHKKEKKKKGIKVDADKDIDETESSASCVKEKEKKKKKFNIF